MCNALFDVTRSGCQWRMLPHDFPKWPTVSWYHRQWRTKGILEAINDAVRRDMRVREGRDPEPSAAIIDSPSVKTTEKGGPAAMTLASR